LQAGHEIVIHLGKPQRLIPRISGSRWSGPIYLWFAVLIFGASSAVTRKLTEIGAQHFIGGHNPISLCNVLFVGNLCALLVLIPLYRHQWNRETLGRLSGKEWFNLVLVAILAGALAPGLIFQALSLAGVNNVVLVGRLEPPLALALSVWILKERVNLWEVLGAIAAFMGVTLTLFLQPTTTDMMKIGGGGVGLGDLLAAIAAIALATATIIGKKHLAQVPLGIYSVFRTALGTVLFFVVAIILYGNNHFMEALSPFLWQWMLLYGVLIVVVGQSFWLKGLRASTVSTASLVASFTPIAGIFAAYLILGEAPTSAQYIGGSVILVGIFLSHMGIKHKVSSPKPTATRNMLPMEKVTQIPEAQAVETKMGFKGI
jgi:drug/metabolite transporter (DMT)-like permease